MVDVEFTGSCGRFSSVLIEVTILYNFLLPVCVFVGKRECFEVEVRIQDAGCTGMLF